MDLSVAPGAAGPTGCTPATRDSSTGRVVVAPASGVVRHPNDPLDSDALCINFDRGESLYIAHLENRSAQGRVEQGDPIGIVAPPNDANGGYAHIHIQLHPSAGCAGSGEPAVAFAGSRRFVGNDDLAFDADPNSTNQHSGKALTRPASDNHDPDPGSTELDVALIIDSSGSMDWNDPQDMRKDAASVFVAKMENTDKVAVVDFDESVRVPWSLNFVGGNRDAIQSAIQSIDSLGGTSIGLGLQAGFDELSVQPPDDRRKAAVLMTDGQGSYSNEADAYEDNGWPIYTVGLSNSVDELLLRDIANQTGGRYIQLTSADQLTQVYFDIATQVTQGQIDAGHGNVMQQGDTWAVTHGIQRGLESLFFLVTWPGSEISTTLLTPDGVVINPDTTDPNVLHAKGLTFEFYRIDNPARGDWVVQMEGTELPEDGELVTLQISSIEDDSGNSIYLPLIVTDQTGPTASEELVYTEWNGVTYDVYKMTADGANKTQLTATQLDEWGPVWSAETDRIAFFRNQNGQLHIYSLSSDGTGLTLLSRNSSSDYDPAWAPDGTKLAFHSYRDGNAEIYTMNADGSNVVRLTNHGASDTHASWSPDGARLTFASDRDGDNEVFIMNADGSGLVQLTSNGHEDHWPVWSPDGAQIAFVSDRDGNEEIYIMNVDGSDQRRLTFHVASDFDVDWSHSGQQLVFASRRNGNAAIFAINQDGSNLRQLTDGTQWSIHPAWRR